MRRVAADRRSRIDVVVDGGGAADRRFALAPQSVNRLRVEWPRRGVTASVLRGRARLPHARDAATAAARLLRLLHPRGQRRQRPGARQDRARLAGQHRRGRHGADRLPGRRAARLHRRDDAVERTLATLRFFAASEQSDVAGRDRLPRLLLPLPRHEHRPARVAMRAVEHRHRAADRRRARRGRVLRRATTRDEAEIRAAGRRCCTSASTGTGCSNGQRRSATAGSPRQGFLPVSLGRLRRGADARTCSRSARRRIRSRADCYDAWCATYAVEDDRGHRLPPRRPAVHPPDVARRGATSAASATRSCASTTATTSRTAGARRWCSSATRSATRTASRSTASTAGASRPATARATARKVVDGVERTFFDYVARGVPDGPDDGTLAPWAVVASLPFAPEIVAPTDRQLATLHVRRANPYGFKASFNPTFDAKPQRRHRLGLAVPLRHQRRPDGR